MTRVPYKGGAPAVNALLTGEAQLSFPASGSVVEFVKNKRLRVIGVTSTKRMVNFPDVPTVAEAGVPGYESLATVGLFAPAKTPAAIVTRLNREVNAAFNRSDVRDRIVNEGQEIGGGTPEQFAAIVDGERRTMGGMIKATGIHED
jgi:tripartite-type tricarboxylate transporter receptor subunit TctC